MNIITLIDNQIDVSKRNQSLIAQHGLSVYVETSRHKLLFDTGADQSFINNAKLLGIDLTLVDTCIISHGHYDHGGGLKAFLALNKTANVYIHQNAFISRRKRKGCFYKDIGLKKSLKKHPQIQFVKGDYKIDDSLLLFQNKSEKFEKPKRNLSLLAKSESVYKPDSFDHELNLLIEDDKRVVLCGCAHNGIVNIMETLKEITNQPIDIVLGGFHLSHSDLDQTSEKAYVDRVNKALKTYDVKAYFTCHCTGQNIYEYMKQSNDKLHQTRTGTMLKL